MATLAISQIIENAGKLTTPVEKAQYLRDHNSDTLRYILELAFYPGVKWELPEGAPPYKPMETPENWGHNRLPKELRKFQYFLKGSTLNPIKRESIFIEVLETVSPEEAKLVLMMKDKKLTYKGITRKLIEEALPEILQGESE